MAKLVTTESSRYLIDEENNYIIRSPGVGSNLKADEVIISNLRKDGEMIALHSVEHCSLGDPMILWLQIRDDNVPTFRLTTKVCSIEEMQ